MQLRVKELAKRLNYRPNPFAQSLRKEAPKMIGVVVPNLVTHYYAAVLDGIEDEAGAPVTASLVPTAMKVSRTKPWR